MVYIHLQPSVVIFTVYHGLQGHETACLGIPCPSSSWFHQGPTSSWPRFRSAGGVSLSLPMESNNYWQPFCLNHPGFIGFGCPWNFPRNNLIITWAFWVSAPIYRPPFPHSLHFHVCPWTVLVLLSGVNSLVSSAPPAMFQDDRRRQRRARQKAPDGPTE